MKIYYPPFLLPIIATLFFSSSGQKLSIPFSSYKSTPASLMALYTSSLLL